MTPRKRDYQLLLELLRWGLASKIPAIRVAKTGVTSPAEPGLKLLPTQVLIEIPYFPIGRRGGVGFPVKASALVKFLESTQFHNQFIKWYAKEIAASLPQGRDLSKTRKSLLHLTVGRKGTLPPRIILKSEYDRLVLELKALRLEAELPLNRNKVKSLLAFGRRMRAAWPQFVDAEDVAIEQLVDGGLQAAAKLILSKKYACSEESVHSCLFRKGK